MALFKKVFFGYDADMVENAIKKLNDEKLQLRHLLYTAEKNPEDTEQNSQITKLEVAISNLEQIIKQKDEIIAANSAKQNQPEFSTFDKNIYINEISELKSLLEKKDIEISELKENTNKTDDPFSSIDWQKLFELNATNGQLPNLTNTTPELSQQELEREKFAFDEIKNNINNLSVEVFGQLKVNLLNIYNIYSNLNESKKALNSILSSAATQLKSIDDAFVSLDQQGENITSLFNIFDNSKEHIMNRIKGEFSGSIHENDEQKPIQPQVVENIVEDNKKASINSVEDANIEPKNTIISNEIISQPLSEEIEIQAEIPHPESLEDLIADQHFEDLFATPAIPETQTQPNLDNITLETPTADTLTGGKPQLKENGKISIKDILKKYKKLD